MECARGPALFCNEKEQNDGKRRGRTRHRLRLGQKADNHPLPTDKN